MKIRERVVREIVSNSGDVIKNIYNSKVIVYEDNLFLVTACEERERFEDGGLEVVRLRAFSLTHSEPTIIRYSKHGDRVHYHAEPNLIILKEEPNIITITRDNISMLDRWCENEDSN